MLTPILTGRQAIVLNAGNPTYSSPIVTLGPDASEIVVTIQRPTTAVPLAWNATAQIEVTITVMVDGVRYRATGKVSGGVRSTPDGDAPAYQLRYTLPVRLGQRARDYIAQSTPDAQGFYNDVPLDRVGLGASAITAQVTIQRIRGSITTAVLVAEVDSQPAPTVRTKNSVAFDAATSATENFGDGVLSLTHTASGSDRAAFVGTGFNSGGSGAGSTGVTYNGVAMTAELWDAVITSNEEHAGYYLKAPATGAQTVTQTLVSPFPNRHLLGVVTLTGVDQTTSVGTAATATGGATSPATVTVAGVVTDGMVVDAVHAVFGPVSVGANQTQRLSATAGDNRLGLSTQASTDGGVMSWTVSSPLFWGIGAVEFKPVAGGAAAELVAAVTGSATLSAALTTGISPRAALNGTAVLAADLTTQIRLASAVAGTATVAADLTTQIRMQAAVTGVATLAADLSVTPLAAELETSLTASASLAPTMVTQIQLEASLTASAVVGMANGIPGVDLTVPMEQLAGEIQPGRAVRRILIV